MEGVRGLNYPLPTFPIMLLFKKKFYNAIRSGQKTQTLRLWKNRRMKSGQRSYIPGIGPIRIGTVEQIELDDLTEEDATRGGMESLEALRSEFDTIYSEKLEQGYMIFRITFAIEEEEG